MKIYDEATQQELTAPDLEAGYLYAGQRVTGVTEAHTEVLPGTVTDARPNGLRRLVPEKPITEPCQWYHAYTGEELAVRNQPSQLDRVEAQAIYTAMMTDTLLEETDV